MQETQVSPKVAEVVSESLHKKRKSDNDKKVKAKKVKKVIPNQCEFYLVNKQRRCAMQRKKDRRFCSEHIQHDDTEAAAEKKGDRVPCPLDPKHSVWVRDLESHLTKCNAKPIERTESWFDKKRNSELRSLGKVEDTSAQGETGSLELQTEVRLVENGTGENDEKDPEAERKLLAKCIELLRKYEAEVGPMEERILQHEGLDTWHEEKENRKHITQQSSLVGQLKEAGLLSPEMFYVEFGCGKAELSRTVNACILHDVTDDTKQQGVYGYGLIDRGVNRMKMDNKILRDCEQASAPNKLEPIVKRSRIDIEHLDLDKFLEEENPQRVVGISKHLCGVATDLTLKLILNSTLLESRFQGLVVAMCCRHACNYDQLLPGSKAYLSEHGIQSAQDFKHLKVVITWAVCGPGGDENSHLSGLSQAEREKMGLVARRMVDESRVHAINQLLAPKFRAQLYKYAHTSTTPENSCLRITRTSLQN